MKVHRINRVLKEMDSEGLSQIIVTSPAAIYYLTGLWIDSGERMIALYLNKSRKHKFIVNRLFPINVELGIDIVWYQDIEDPIDILSKIVDKDSILGVDKYWSAHFLINLMNRNTVKGFVNSSKIIDKIRMIKDDEEINLMRESSRINDRVMKNLWKEFKEGYSEKYYASILSDIYEKEGANKFSFSPIIAFSGNGADPHHNSGKDLLKKGQSILIDIGGVYKKYCSDMTRTVFFGEEPSKEHKKIYEIVKQANELAINKVKPGVKFKDIDLEARNYIESEGYGEFFTHRTGHSIGIECHEFGDVSSTNEDILKPGMIFSVEPGIYLSNNIGVRIEDLVLVTEDGHGVLNSVTKEIVVL